MSELPPNPPPALPPTLAEAPALERRGTYVVMFHKDGARALRLPADRPLTIGRAPDCDITIDSPLLSRVHFAIQDGAPPLIEDRKSSNGTKLNGRRLEPSVPTPLDIGTMVEAGGVFFMLQDHAPRESLAAPPPSSRAPSVAPREPTPGVIVADPSMQRLHDLVELVARSSLSVLVLGETGVGKEVVSAAVHARSGRASKPFVSLNCAALPEALLESELFGYERGAFTGATQAKPGLIEAAHEGTLFLDEIGEMPLTTQSKLLRVLENGELLRLGALKPRIVDVRFLAATNQNLPALVAAGTFRRDLYFRLNGITLPIPPLRERPSEIAPLARFFLEREAKRASRPVPALDAGALELLAAHTWPGNVRELRNVIQRALTLCAGATIRREHVLIDRELSGEPPPIARAASESSAAPLPLPLAGAAAGENKSWRLARVDPDEERRRILEALDRAGGNQGKASEILGISRRTLINRLNEYGVKRPRKRD